MATSEAWGGGLSLPVLPVCVCGPLRELPWKASPSQASTCVPNPLGSFSGKEYSIPDGI